MRGRRWSRAALVLGALVSAAAIVSACGGDSSEDDDAGTGGDTPAAASTAPATEDGATVRAVEEAGDPRTAWTYDPAQITVAVGDGVVFANAGEEVHTATADDGSFDTGTLSTGDETSVTFDEAGTFAYHCSLHPWMKGEVVVTPAG